VTRIHVVTAGNELIRAAVKRNIYNHVIMDERMATMCVEAEMDAYSTLKGQTTRKKVTISELPRHRTMRITSRSSYPDLCTAAPNRANVWITAAKPDAAGGGVAR
jgi:hypothetical protein